MKDGKGNVINGLTCEGIEYPDWMEYVAMTLLAGFLGIAVGLFYDLSTI